MMDLVVLAHPDAPAARGEDAAVLGTLDLAHGRYGRAAAYFEQAAFVARQVTLSLAGRRRNGHDATRPGPAGRGLDAANVALAALRRAEAWPRATGLVPAAVAAALGCGKSAAAEELVREAEAGMEGRTSPAAFAELFAARGWLAGEAAPDQAAAHFEEAYRHWRDIGRPYPATHAAELRAYVLARLAETDAATTSLDAATRVYRASTRRETSPGCGDSAGRRG
ncbi:hypothetical protein [Streptomyces hydrogenans]